MKSRAIFISATDTGVGKTMVTALMLGRLRERGVDAIALKPVSAGDRNDARLFQSLLCGILKLDEINPVHFRRPLAPMIAARLEKREWDPRGLRSVIRRQSSRFAVTIVEGVGGLLVPLRRGYLVRDFVRELNLPLLLVARAGLGTINHTALTVEAARAVEIPVLGVILNHSTGNPEGLAERTNARAIEETCGVKVIARVPFVRGLQPEADSIRAALKRPSVRRAVDDAAALL